MADKEKKASFGIFLRGNRLCKGVGPGNKMGL